MKAIETVLAKLRESGAEPVETSAGWQCRCPAHEDAKASLSLSETADGKALMKCHASCATEIVMAKLGLTMADLFPPRSDATAPIVYQYHDEDGDVVLEKVRYVPKRFVQRRPVPGYVGEFVYNLNAGWARKNEDGWKMIAKAADPKTSPGPDCVWLDAVPHVLYRQTEVKAAIKAGRTILMVEGEKDVETLVKLGLDATTNSGGASEAWRPEYGEVLRGAKVVFIPDQDKAGVEHFEKYAPELSTVVAELHRLDLPDGCKDITDYVAAGHSRADVDALMTAAPIWNAGGPTAEILDDSPEVIRRPLGIVGGRGYAATWVTIRQGDKDDTVLVVLRDDGQLFADRPIPDALPLRELGLNVDLPNVPDPDRLLSGAGVKRYAGGDRPDPAQVFGRVRRIVDHYMDFGRSLGTQDELVDLTALTVLVTYLLDAFNVVGYVWPNGDKGVGKTKFLITVTDLGYLGLLVLAGGSYASLRDLADYGACLGFDDAEGVMDVRRSDPDKRTLLLAGNRRGTYVTLKEPCGDGWKNRRVHAFCPRLFSAINLPDEVLASRTIVIPLVRSSDGPKANRDPSDHDAWPEKRQRLVDDLWAVGLANLARARQYDRRVVEHTTLVGRNLEPWRAILAVALWLQQEHHVDGLFDRMADLAVRYQTERIDIEQASPVRIAIAAMQGMMAEAKGVMIDFAPSQLADAMNRLARDEEVEHAGETFTTPQKVGALLRRQRVERAARTAAGKRWRIGGPALDALARAYGIATLEPSGTPGNQCRDAESAGCADLQEGVEGAAAIGTTTQPLVSGEAVECRDAESAGCADLQVTPSTTMVTNGSVTGGEAVECRDADCAPCADLLVTPSEEPTSAGSTTAGSGVVETPAAAANDLQWDERSAS